jgi:hypothetical protein
VIRRPTPPALVQYGYWCCSSGPGPPGGSCNGSDLLARAGQSRSIIRAPVSRPARFDPAASFGRPAVGDDSLSRADSGSTSPLSQLSTSLAPCERCHSSQWPYSMDPIRRFQGPISRAPACPDLDSDSLLCLSPGSAPGDCALVG